MKRHHEPNASYYSARYAERKRAAERARDLAAGPSPCLRCPTVQAKGSLFCAAHAEEYARLLQSGCSPDEVTAFCQRTYWPGA